MKTIINRGFDKTFTEITMFRNGQHVIDCPLNGDCCECDAEEGDQITIKFRFLDTSTLTIASFSYHNDNDIIYVSPTMMYRRWELVCFKILPYFSILFLVLKPAIKSDKYEWFCTSMIILTALLLICFQLSTFVPSIRNKFFKLESL